MVSFGAYNEIPSPRRKCALIAYENLMELAGFETYDMFRESHRHWLYESLKNGNNSPQSQWTRSIAVGSEGFVEKTKQELGIRAKGRKVLDSGVGFQLRESKVSYCALFDTENDDIGVKKATCGALIQIFQ